MPKYPEPLVYGPSANHNASVIVIHGLGDSGRGWYDFGPELGKDLPYAKFIFPTASEMPVTLNMGMRMNAWYDIYSLERLEGRGEDETNLRASSQYIESLVEREVQSGIQSDRVVVAGFSQGGALALLSLRNPKKLAGVLGLSSYLTLAKEPLFSQINKQTPLLMCHGESDPVVQFRYGKDSFELLKAAGANVTLKTYPGLGHSVAPQEIDEVQAFLNSCLPKV